MLKLDVNTERDLESQIKPQIPLNTQIDAMLCVPLKSFGSEGTVAQGG